MRRTLTLAAAIFAAANTANAALTVVTTQAEFEAATGTTGIVEEIFPAAIPSATEITFSTGVVSTASNGFSAGLDNAVLFPDTGPSDGFGEYFTGIGSGSIAPTTITFTFPRPIVGFFAPFESATGIDVAVVGEPGLFDISELGVDNTPPIQGFDGTFGLVSSDLSETFTQIVFSVDPAFGNFDLFGLNSLQFADPSFSRVPEPTAASLLLLSLSGLGLSRHRRK